MSNLDDFFKKRDKKKKTKFVTLNTDEFAKQLEATSIRNIEDEGEFQENNEFGSNQFNPTSGGGGGGGNGDNPDEEWKPFDSEDNKDYSGLRIKIQNWKAEDEENNNEGLNDEQEKKAACPWGSCATTTNSNSTKSDEQTKTEDETKEVQSKVTTPNQTESKTETTTDTEANVSAQTATTTATTTTTTSSTGSAYVPPHLRKKESSSTDKPAESSSSGKYVPPSLRNKTSNDSAIPPTSVNYRRPNKSQPNIMDTSEFPTLNAAVVDNTSSDKVPNGNERFELPKKSGRVESKTAGGMIEIENKFTALSSSNN